MPIEKIKTGIVGFDDLAEGGLPKGRSVLVSGSPGSGKTVFGLEFLYRGLLAGEPGVFVTFEERKDDLLTEAAGLGWDLASFEKKGLLTFVDASSIAEHQVEAGEYDFGGLISRIRHAVTKVGAKRVTIDSLASLFLRYKDNSLIRRELFRIIDLLRRLGVTTVITAERVRDDDPVSRFGVEDFVADGVIHLYHALQGGERERQMEILKLRGTRHQTGMHPFLIGDGGLTVFPEPKQKFTEESPTKRLSTGVGGLDAMTDGGLYVGSTTLLMGPSGTGRTVLGLHFLAEGVRRHERGILFSFEEAPAQLFTDAATLGWNFRAAARKGLLKVSAFASDSAPLESFLRRMVAEIEEFRPKRVVIDSLTPLASAVPERRFRRFIVALNAALKRRGVTSIVNYTSGAAAAAFAAESDLAVAADNIIVMKFSERGAEMEREILIVKARASAHEKDARRYSVTRRGLQVFDGDGPESRAPRRRT